MAENYIIMAISFGSAAILLILMAIISILSDD